MTFVFQKRYSKFLLFLALICPFSLLAQTYNMPSGTISTCTGTFYDSGGSGTAYKNNENKTVTFCPATATDYLTITFTSFALDVNFDYLYVYDGSSTAAPLLGTYSANSPGTVNSLTAGGCLTFKFTSDGSVTAAGWAALISCSSTKPIPPNQDCIYSKPLCGTTKLDDNNSGAGTVSDLSASNQDCFQGEHQSSWYQITIGTSGTLDFEIKPTNPCDDYDFAVWGPASACPPKKTPIRCSVACHSCTNTCGLALGNNGTTSSFTGLRSGAPSTTEASTSNVGYVQDMTVNAGEVYYIMVDNSQTNGANGGFTLTFGGSAALTNCPLVLPLDLISFEAKRKGNHVDFDWKTASEENTAYFQVEKSTDGASFFAIGSKIKAAGQSSTVRFYTASDFNPLSEISYYRLKQVDIDGRFKISPVVLVRSPLKLVKNIYLDKNPISFNSASFQLKFFSATEETLEVEIVNNVGLRISSLTLLALEGDNLLNYPLEGLNLQAGIYFVKLKIAGQQQVLKLLLN